MLLGLKVKAVKCMLLAESTQFVVQWRKHVTSISVVSPGEVFCRSPSSSCMDSFRIDSVKIGYTAS